MIMPRFIDILKAIDWDWWMERMPVRIDWWPDAQLYLYVYPCRLAVVLSAIAVVLCAVIFAMYSYQRACDVVRELRG